MDQIMLPQHMTTNSGITSYKFEKDSFKSPVLTYSFNTKVPSYSQFLCYMTQEVVF